MRVLWSVVVAVLVACVLVVQWQQYKVLERMARPMPTVQPANPSEMVASWFSGGHLHVCKVTQGEFDPNETAAQCGARFAAKVAQDVIDFPKDNS